MEIIDKLADKCEKINKKHVLYFISKTDQIFGIILDNFYE